MAKIVYYSKRGTVEKIVQETGLDNFKIVTGEEIVNEPFILFTPTYGFGETPVEVTKFLENNSKNLKAVAGSGNMARHAETFNFASINISKTYNVDSLVELDGEGTEEERDTFIQKAIVI